ncbi:MAG: hypothetical protein IJK23_00625 [Clostridia bacterium]|nr:hypothetical protein [Clostridia bacterium]
MRTTHMNLFNSYTQKGSMPIENNISRGLAILFRENRSFLLLFLQELNNKQYNNKKEQNAKDNAPTNAIQIDFPYDTYEVGFQTPADEFDIASKVIGVTLTSEDLPDYTEGLSNKDDNGSIEGRKITDIAVAYDDTLIIIEVKRNNTDCRDQVSEQIDKYKQTVNCSEEIISTVVELTWPDIVRLLGRDIRLNHGSDLLSNDYRDFLLSYYPKWARSEHLSLLDPSQEEEIQARLKTLQNLFVNYHNKNNGKEDENEDEFYINKNDIIIDNLYYYVRLVRFGFTERMLSGESKKQPYVTINMWPGDTITQSNSLRWRINKSFVNKRHQFVEIESIKADIEIWPYLKFSYYRSEGQVWLSQKEMENNQIDTWLSMAEKINKKIKKEAWEKDLKSVILQNRSMFDPIELESFQKQFNTVFEEPGRAEANVSCGFAITVSFPYESIKKLDSKNASDKAFPELIDETIKRITSSLIRTDC